jgi:cytochrome c biogenesis factor
MIKKINPTMYVLLIAVTLILLCVTLVGSFGDQDVFSSPAVYLSLGLMALITVIGIIFYDPKKAIRAIGFYLLHAGIVLFLLGQLVYTVAGYKVNVSMQENSRDSYDKIKTANGEILELGFELGMGEFTAEYYDDGSPKHYEAELIINGSPVSVTVNHPVRYNGYKMYLMSSSKDQSGEEYVSMLVKYDPGEFVSSFGIIMIIVGSFVICFARPLRFGISDTVKSKAGDKK